MIKTWRCVLCCKVALAFTFILYLFSLTGCGPTLSTPEQVAEFEKAGPLILGLDIDGSTEAQGLGPYRVLPGDILEFQMPAVLRVISSDLSEWLRPLYGHKDVESYLGRVSDSGTITLPIVGELHVGGKTLADIESLVINAYYPKYVVSLPMVVCEVSKYQGEGERIFTVMGLVNDPDAFPYPPDVQYNLMEVLAFAGGLDMVADPRYVKIYRQDVTGYIVDATFGIDSKSLSDAYSVLIKPGDVVYVDHTLRTRTNRFMADVLQIRLGVDVRRTRSD